MLRSIVLAAGVALIASAAAAVPIGDRYSSFWVFGDSLSDPGNLFAFTSANGLAPTPPSPPYFEGRFSNGPVWAEAVADRFAVSGNLAFGGATATGNAEGVPDLGDQIGLYGVNGAPAAGARPLASVWFGANDIIDAIVAFGAQADVVAQVGAAAVAAADAVGAGVRALGALGVTDVAVWNLPDIGQTPRFAEFLPDAVGGLASLATGLFNTRLDAVIADLRGERLNVTRIDTFALFRAVLDNPAAYGVTGTALPCLFPDAATAAAFGRPQLCADAAGLLWFDSIHPTALGQAVLADTFVAAVPLPASGLLLALGLGALALRRRAA